MPLSFALVALATILISSSAFTIHFQNDCPYTVWAAIGRAPDGAPQSSPSYGKVLPASKGADFGIDDHALGIRAWGRTGCDANGANCATGQCNGGLVCTDAGITSGALLSEYGFGDQGQWGGERTSWNLSKVNGTINIPATLSSSDGQSVKCTPDSCPPDQAYSIDSDHQAVRNSALGATYTHKFC